MKKIDFLDEIAHREDEELLAVSIFDENNNEIIISIKKILE